MGAATVGLLLVLAIMGTRALVGGAGFEEWG